MRRIPAGLIALVAVLGLTAVACGGDDDDSTASQGSTTTAAGAADNTVSVTAVGFAFSPNTATAKAGEVSFDVKNEDDTAHTFTIDGTSVDIKVDGGSSGSGDADLDAGTYEWHCAIHPSMTGTLTVS